MGVFEKAIIPADELVEFIPQRAPIVMVDEFYGLDGDLSMSGLTVSDQNIFCEAGVLSECGLIEHIAQSAALRMGYLYKSAGKDVPLGYIGSVNKFKLYRMPKVGQSIKTQIRLEQEIMNISLISASCRVEGDLVAECMMKIYLQE